MREAFPWGKVPEERGRMREIKTYEGPHPSRLRRATFPGGEGLGKRIATGIPVRAHSQRNPIYTQKSPMPLENGIGDFSVCVTA